AGAEPGREDTVEEVRRTASLDVADLGAAGLDARTFLDPPRDLLADAAFPEQLVRELVRGGLRALSLAELDSLGDDHESVPSGPDRVPDAGQQRQLVVRLLRHER